MDIKMKLWGDCKSNEERLEFLENSKAVETGIVAPAIVNDLINIYKYAGCGCGICLAHNNMKCPKMEV
jgi:hypothetical protein